MFGFGRLNRRVSEIEQEQKRLKRAERRREILDAGGVELLDGWFASARNGAHRFGLSMMWTPCVTLENLDSGAMVCVPHWSADKVISVLEQAKAKATTSIEIDAAMMAGLLKKKPKKSRK